MTTQELRIGFTDVTVICDRCKQQISGAASDLFTAGYYEVGTGTWEKFANPGEYLVCDDCMHNDERYKAVYGKHQRTAVLPEGRELDILIGKQVMKYSVYHYDKGYAGSNFYQLMDDGFDPVLDRYGERKTEAEAWSDTPRFSTDVSAAWPIAELYRLCVVPFGDGWTAVRQHKWRSDAHRFASETAPLAICRAALDLAGATHE